MSAAGRLGSERLEGWSAGGGADLLRHVQVRLGHQEAQASSSQTDQVHRAVTSRKQEVGRDERQTDQVSSYSMLSRDREDDGRSAAINESDQSGPAATAQRKHGKTVNSESLMSQCFLSGNRRPVPLVVGPDQTGSVHGQDAIADPQPPVGGGRPVRDQGADVDARSVERSVLQSGGHQRVSTVCGRFLKTTLLNKPLLFLTAIL